MDIHNTYTHKNGDLLLKNNHMHVLLIMKGMYD